MTQDRAARLDVLRQKRRTQVLVVGGGINGISTFRELALNGVDVVLVERDDFMSGASAAPSRMIHGGLRYMENGEFALVKESLRERNLLLANAPHLVTPLPTLIPITDRWSGIWSAARRFLGGNVPPGNRGALIVKLGLALYDLYAGAAGGMPKHRFFGRRETRRRWPELRPDAVFGAVYYDARISHPERLGIELILETELHDNALALNHVGLEKLSDGVAVLRDAQTGEKIELDADIIVNATGAWIDLTNRELAKAPGQLIGGTKGSHLVIANEWLKRAVGDEMVYFANSEGRVCIIFAHLGNVLAGSTDIGVETPEGVRCEADEVDYILASVREVFPDIEIRPDEIIYRFAGVRPLPSSDGTVTANISRDHSCDWLVESAGSARPVLNLVGGKWTTFRAFGEEAADKVLERLDRKRLVSTEDRQIGGGRDFPAGGGRSAWIENKAPKLDATYAGLLLDRYGTRANDFLNCVNIIPPPLTPPRKGEGDTPASPPSPPPPCGEGLGVGVSLATLALLNSLPAYTREEIEWLVATERVVTLADLVLRRMTIAFSGELSLAAIDELDEIAGDCLGWDAATRRQQKDRLLEQLEKFHGLSEEQLRGRNPDRKEDDVRRQESAHEPVVRQRQMS